MKDTIEECWDQDPEARVSAVCVEERCREMGVMWDNWHRCKSVQYDTRQYDLAVRYETA